MICIIYIAVWFQISHLFGFPASSSRMPLGVVKLHPMYTTILGPPAKRLPLEVKQDTKEAPQRNKGTVCHNRRRESEQHS